MRLYDFSAGEKAAKDAGLSFSDAVADQVDPEFAALGLSQAQVDRLLVLHVHYLNWALGAYEPFWRRALLALFVLRGRAK